MKRIRGIRLALPRKNDAFSGISTPQFFPKRVVLPLALPWVGASILAKKGDRVLAGQPVLAHPEGLFCPVYASVSGTVTDIRPWAGVEGQAVLSAVIEADGSEEIQPLSERYSADLGIRDLHRLIYEAGVREADPYPWPLFLRVAQPALTPPILLPFFPDLRRPIDFLIVNGMDREPGLSLRRSVLASRHEEVLEGIGIVKKLSAARKTVLTVAKDQKFAPRAETMLTRSGVEIVRCPDRYPLSLEPLLVQFITGREVPQPGGNSRAVGAAVLDVVTVMRLFESLNEGIPSVHTLFQFSSNEMAEDTYVRLREGTLLSELLEHSPPKAPAAAKVILGGALQGHAQHSTDVPLLQGLDSVLIQGETSLSHFENEPCINCGYCVRSCPMNLMPNELSKFCEYGQFRQAQQNYISHCIECGICAYVCPVRRPMVHLLRFGKQELAREES